MPAPVRAPAMLDPAPPLLLSPHGRPGELRRDLLRALAILAITVVSYLPVLHAGFVWDDDQHVMHTPQQTSLHGLRDLWFTPGFQPQYYPLTHTSFWIEYQLWGTRPLGYHLVNVLLHAINALLVWRALRRLNFAAAFVVAVLFAIHPVCVESVAWVSERKNTLSTFFYLLAAIAYLRFDPPGDAEPRARRRWGMYALGSVLFVCALLSKSVACSLPAALLLVIWWRRGRIDLRRDVLPLVPWLIIGAALGLNTAAKERFGVGASGPEWDFSAVDRVLIAGRAMWFYAGKLAFPWPLAFNYPRWTIDARQPWQYAYPLAAIGVIVLLWTFRRRIGRGPLVAVLFFVGTLVPALGFFNLYPMRFSFVADHMQYVASLGLLSLAAAGYCRLRSTALRQIIAIAVVVLFCGLTYWQAGAYESAETLWRDTLAKYPNQWMPNLNLGVLLAERHEPDEAAKYLHRSLELNPDQPEAHLALGDLDRQLEHPADALREYREAVRIAPRNFRAHYEVARALLAGGDSEGAVQEFQQALSLEPRFVLGHIELANLLARLGRMDEAVRQMRRAAELNPDEPALQNNFGVMLLRASRPQEALGVLKTTIERWPANAQAHANLAAALESLGNRPAALQEYRRAAQLQPDLAAAREGIRRLEDGGK